MALVLVLVLATGCGALRRTALRDVARVLSSPSGPNVFVEDNDPELIGDALPFVLKGYEALLAAEPRNRDLCLTTAETFVKYANLFIHEEAQRLEKVDFKRARYLRQRATKLYLRGRDYALECLAIDYPDFEKRLRQDSSHMLHALSSTDVDNMSLVAELPVVEAMMRRSLELNQDFEDGVIHEFFITYEGSRSEAMGGSAERAMEHFNRAVKVTRGEKASPYVSLASSVAVRKQDCRMFKDLLNKALAIDPDTVPEWRLANTMAREKAQWLLDHREELFLDCKENEH
jgi:predicted anti-sigma-YlaC factor YlaD